MRHDLRWRPCCNRSLIHSTMMDTKPAEGMRCSVRILLLM